MAQNELVLNCTKDELDEAIRRFNSDEYMKKPIKHLKITENIKDKGILDYATLEVDVRPNLWSGLFITPSDRQQVFNPKDYSVDGFGSFTVDKIPDGYIDTSGATAGEYDIFKGKNCFVNGKLVTGEYQIATAVLTGSDTGCTTTKLRIACPFKPTHINALYLSSTHQANKVYAITAWIGDYYCCKALGSATSGKYSLYRAEIKLNSENNSYFYWDGTYAYLASPNSSYLFSTNQTYRVFVYK